MCTMYLDEVNVSLLLDNHMARLVDPLKPHYNVFSLEEPQQFSGNIEIPKPVIATISNWLHGD